MPAANLCEQCKSHTTPDDSSPSGGSNRSSVRSSAPRGGGGGQGCSSPSKPVYVRKKPSEKTCIVLGQGDACGGNQISLQLPTSGNSSSSCGGNNLKLKYGGSGGNCIEILGYGIIKSAKWGLQIESAGKGKGGGGLQISLGKEGRPVLQLGGSSARNCGSSASGGKGGGVQVCPGGSGQLQLSFGKATCGGGGPLTICETGGQNVEISHGPQKRKLDMNHCKPTIAFMIHKRLVELETEQRMAESAHNDLHPNISPVPKTNIHLAC